jgi:hypothetical protein
MAVSRKGRFTELIVEAGLPRVPTTGLFVQPSGTKKSNQLCGMIGLDTHDTLVHRILPLLRGLPIHKYRHLGCFGCRDGRRVEVTFIKAKHLGIKQVYQLTNVGWIKRFRHKSPFRLKVSDLQPDLASILPIDYPRFDMFYNGLQLKLEKRFSTGLTFRDAYTWSKDLGTSQGSPGGAVQNSFDTNLERGYVEPISATGLWEAGSTNCRSDAAKASGRTGTAEPTWPWVDGNCQVS